MPDPSVTVIFDRIASGDRHAAGDLLPLVYQQLRASAQKVMSAERPDHTLQATALVHEAYAKLVGGQQLSWANRAHFYDAAGRAMRQILIDHARSRNSQKRGGGVRTQEMTDFASALEADSERILALDEALSRLEQEDAELANVVRLRFFTGLSGDQTAEVLGVSARKVDMLWARARAWLFRAIDRPG